MVKEYFVFRELDLLIVKGKTKPIKVFELLGRKSNGVAQEKISAVGEYHKGLEMYRRKEFAAAIQQFAKALAIDPSDEPSRLYTERSQALLTTPPPDNWDGVFVLKTN
jgi:adenylate cyclase